MFTPHSGHWLIALVLALAAHAGAVLWWTQRVSGQAAEVATAGIELNLSLLGKLPEPQASAERNTTGIAQAESAPQSRPESEPAPAKPVQTKKVTQDTSPTAKPVAKFAKSGQAQKPAESTPKPKRAKKITEPKPKQAKVKPTTPKKTPKSKPRSTQSPQKTKPSTPAAAGKPAADKVAATTSANSQKTQTAIASRQRAISKRDYMASLSAWLNRHKRYPRSAQRRHQEGTVRLRFALDRSGRLLAADVIGSSGYAALDKAALDMLRKAAPLPPIPPEIGQSRLDVVLPVAFDLR